MRFIKRLALGTDGQDLLEYALLASIICLGVLAALGPLGVRVSTSYQNIETALSEPASPGGGHPGNSGNNGRGGGSDNGGGNNGGGSNGSGGSNGRGGGRGN